MTLSEWSYAAMVTAAVAYLVAFALHALEWSGARGLAAVRPEDGSEDAARIKVDFRGRLGVAATVLGAVLHVGAVVLRGVAAQRAPWGNMYEFVTAAFAFAIILYLVCVWRLGMRWLGLGMTLLATLALGLAVTEFYVEVAPLVPALHSVWFIIHIIAACISGAAFNVGAVAAALYLIRDRAEARAAARGDGALTGYIAKLPSLGKERDKINVIMEDTLAHAFDYVVTNRVSFTDVASLLEKLRALYTAPKSSNQYVLSLRDSIEKIVSKETHLTHQAALAAVRTALMLYFVLRAIAGTR